MDLAVSRIQEELVREAILWHFAFLSLRSRERGRRPRELQSGQTAASYKSASIRTEDRERKTSTRPIHCNSLVSKKRDWFTLRKLVDMLE